jgi:hypothetical protein
MLIAAARTATYRAGCPKICFRMCINIPRALSLMSIPLSSRTAVHAPTEHHTPPDRGYGLSGSSAVRGVFRGLREMLAEKLLGRALVRQCRVADLRRNVLSGRNPRSAGPPVYLDGATLACPSSVPFASPSRSASTLWAASAAFHP